MPGSYSLHISHARPNAAELAHNHNHSNMYLTASNLSVRSLQNFGPLPSHRILDNPSALLRLALMAAALPVASSPPPFALRPSSWRVEVCSEVGGRPRQEDRYDVRQSVPLPGGHEAAFFGVWDGTVCQHASDFVHTRCAGHHVSSPGFGRVAELLANELVAQEAGPDAVAAALAEAVREGYAATDAELLASCRELSNHYTSSTSVTCLCGAGLLTIGHLGDSRAYLVTAGAEAGTGGRSEGVRGVQLTVDHKPDDPEERRRIEAMGGSIQLLHHHNNKPFIRGGDFDRRKASGERVMQLQCVPHRSFAPPPPPPPPPTPPPPLRTHSPRHSINRAS